MRCADVFADQFIDVARCGKGEAQEVLADAPKERGVATTCPGCVILKRDEILLDALKAGRRLRIEIDEEVSR